MLHEVVEQGISLEERLSLRPTSDYAAVILGDQDGDAVLSENWGFIRREAEAIAVELAGKDAISPPVDYHALGRENRRTWVHPKARGHRVSIGRVFRYEDLDYENSDVLLTAITGLRGAPILIAATATEPEGKGQRRAIEKAGVGAIAVCNCELLDMRRYLPRSQDPTMRRLSESFAHPLLPIPAALPSALPAAQ
jgi:hypothetical protein